MSVADPRVYAVVGLEEMAVKGLDCQLELVLVDHEPDVHLGGALAEHEHLKNGVYDTTCPRARRSFQFSVQEFFPPFFSRGHWAYGRIQQYNKLSLRGTKAKRLRPCFSRI